MPAKSSAVHDSKGGESPLKILFVVSECAPYAKTGGLADVAAALPAALQKLGHDVRIVMPLYDCIDRNRHGIRPDGAACVHMGNGEEQWVGVHNSLLGGKTPVWLVECHRFFGRPGIYDELWGEYGDNAFRYALLSKAALQICKDRKFIPDVMHAHDWQSALVPVFLKTWDRILSPLSDTASVLTIHNIGHQGVYHSSVFPYIGVGDEHFTQVKFEDHGKINLLKGGIFFADAITTVSPTHAREIFEPIGGHGLAPRLQARRDDVTGILNGVCYDRWNPETDSLIPVKYSAKNLAGKWVCKMALQERFGLETRLDTPIFGVVSRLAPQKGLHLLKEVLPRIMDQMNAQVVVLGSGDSGMEDFFRWAPSAYPGRVGSFIGFWEDLSHLIEAGSDFFVMPSLYEPCGLNQMYSMKYGTLPVVRATGGLNDSVQNYDEATGAGTGFKFWDPTPDALYYTIGWAVSTWHDRPQHMSQLRQQAMAQDYSWRDSAQRYLDVYRHAIWRHSQWR
ncbi:MAG: glycogen synthase GlgA [Verrucomicrobiae bacterium]|nr:glycogen synthase GlgA [Verrucomicrobiae bacterium]